jgi:hypothetical protein
MGIWNGTASEVFQPVRCYQRTPPAPKDFNTRRLNQVRPELTSVETATFLTAT